MLTTYLKTPQTLARYHSGPAGPHLEPFVRWLEVQRYPPRRIVHLLRGVHRFSGWADSAGYPLQKLDTHALEAYGHALDTLQRLRYPSGHLSHLFVGARHFVHFLELTGLVASATSCLPLPSEPALLEAFRQWMQTHRGTTQATLSGYRLTLTALLDRLGDQPERFQAQALRTFVLELAGQGGIGRAKTIVTAVRMFLRFCIAIGRCRPGLDHALPTIAQWRLASLPKYLPAETVAQVLATCDRTTPRGMRDYAVLVLLARLGLRAGEVAALQWRDIDWHDATFCVTGKTQRTARLPLPQEVGDALLVYGERARPHVSTPHVFLTITAPVRPLSAKAVSQVAARALRCAHVASPSYGAHVFRHSAATQMVRQGASLPSIGAVLRHASLETTAHYAKVDVALLHRVARPWPEVTQCSYAL
jgi:integrase/recombinase XerD